jgi:hypothetical protein
MKTKEFELTQSPTAPTIAHEWNRVLPNESLVKVNRYNNGDWLLQFRRKKGEAYIDTHVRLTELGMKAVADGYDAIKDLAISSTFTWTIAVQPKKKPKKKKQRAKAKK